MKLYYFFKKHIIKFFCCRSQGALLANKTNKTLKHLLKKPVFEKNSGNWINVLNVVRKRFKKQKHFPTKITPIHSPLEKNEK